MFGPIVEYEIYREYIKKIIKRGYIIVNVGLIFYEYIIGEYYMISWI